jgi:CO dehydrogenase maturation factor
MKVAVAGKGGSGKSTVTGALARLLARQGHQVVAIDADPNPNLGISLGMPCTSVETMRPILNALLDSGHTHDDPRPPAEELLSRYGVEAPDGVTLVATGKIERPSSACLCCGSHNTTRQFFGELSGDDRIVLADLEAGLNDLIWAHPGPRDVVLAVTEGSAKSVEVARRACRLAEEMGVTHIIGVANRAFSEVEVAALARALEIETAFGIPEDPAVEQADHLGVAPIDVAPGSPALVAIDQLAQRITFLS